MYYEAPALMPAEGGIWNRHQQQQELLQQQFSNYRGLRKDYFSQKITKNLEKIYEKI